MLVLLIKFLLAHCIGDFLFQPTKWVNDKEHKKVKSPFLYWHILVHFSALVLVLQFQSIYWLGIICVVLSHYVIDLTKLYLLDKTDHRNLFFIDQIAHVLVIVAVVYSYNYQHFNLTSFPSYPFLLFIFFVLFSTKVSAVFVKVFMSKWNMYSANKEESLLNAGMYIGILERLFVFTFVVMNYWVGIGFLLAAKSVFRFGDLSRAKDRKLTEYILIGTLISFGLAIGAALSYLFCLNQID
jgi:hypothetical protein